MPRRVKLVDVQSYLVSMKINGKPICHRKYGLLHSYCTDGTLHAQIIFMWRSKRDLLDETVRWDDAMTNVRISWPARRKPQSWTVFWPTHGNPLRKEMVSDASD